jgi:hypothetical protein
MLYRSVEVAEEVWNPCLSNWDVSEEHLRRDGQNEEDRTELRMREYTMPPLT